MLFVYSFIIEDTVYRIYMNEPIDLIKITSKKSGETDKVKKENGLILYFLVLLNRLSDQSDKG